MHKHIHTSLICAHRRPSVSVAGTQQQANARMHTYTQAWFDCLLFSFLWPPHKLVIAFCFEDNFPSWNGGILAISFSLHPHACLQFSPLLSILTAFLSFHSFSPPSFGGQFAVTAVQTGGPKPLRYFSSLAFPASLHSLSLSVLPGCLARWTMLDLFVLSALCIWIVLCARLGLRPEVHVSARIRVCFVSLHENVITLQFTNLKLTWLRLPKSATLLVLTPLIWERTFSK